MPSRPNPLLPNIPYLLTWRTSFFARDEYPYTLVSGLPTTAPPGQGVKDMPWTLQSTLLLDDGGIILHQRIPRIPTLYFVGAFYFCGRGGEVFNMCNLKSRRGAGSGP